MKPFDFLTLETDYSKRVYGLDVFRAVAILLVVLSHSGFILGTVLPGFPYIKLIDGVELFFVLSGFLIGTILITMYEKNASLNFPQLLHFWKRRWFRTLPGYYLVLGINVIFVYAGLIHGDPSKINWKFLLFLQNFSTYFTDFFWESWSLTVEEWFYIFTPLSLLVLSRLLRNRMSVKYIVLLSVLSFILLPLGWRIYISGEQVDYFWYDVKFRKVVLTRLDAIMFGVLFAWFKFYFVKRWNQLAVPLFVTGILLMYTCMYAHAANPTGWYGKTLYFSCIGFSAALLLPLADRTRQFRTRFGKAMTHVSLVSYSMYLLNLLVASIIHKNLESAYTSQPILFYILFWVAVLVFSTLLYKYYEKPMMDLRDRSSG